MYIICKNISPQLVYNKPDCFSIFTPSLSKITALKLEYFKYGCSVVIERVWSLYKGDNYKLFCSYQGHCSAAALNRKNHFPGLIQSVYYSWRAVDKHLIAIIMIVQIIENEKKAQYYHWLAYFFVLLTSLLTEVSSEVWPWHDILIAPELEHFK